MVANTSSSTDSDGGGAPLHSTSASASSHRRHGRGKSTDPTTDDESKLLNASNAFTTQPDPFVGQPTYPQSVRPSNYRPYNQRMPVPQPNNGSQALTRYRGSLSSNDSRSSGYQSGFLPGPSNEERSLQMSRLIHQRIMTTTQFIRVSPGCTSDLASRHQQMMQEISQLVNSTINNVRLERDQALRERNEQHEKFKRALYDESQTKDQRDKAQADCKLATEKARDAENELKACKERVEDLKEEINSFETHFAMLRDHYQEMIKRWSKTDERTLSQTQALELEIKRLRSRNAELANMAGVPAGDALVESAEFPSPSVPGSFKNANLPEGSLKNRSSGEQGLSSTDREELLALLKKNHGIKDEDNPRLSSNFKPNPKAPVWNPFLRKGSPGPAPRTAGPSRGALLKGKEKEKLDSSAGITRAENNRTPGRPGRPFHPPAQPKSPKTPGNVPGALVKRSGIARDKEYWDVEDVRAGIDHLYGIIKGYIVNCHMKSEPPKVLPHMLEVKEAATWNYMKNLLYSNPQQAESHLRFLMGFPGFRPYIVMRISLDYLYTKMISPQLFLGFSPEMDAHLYALQEQISTFKQGSTGSYVRARQRVIDEHARIIHHAMKAPGMAKFRTETIERHATMLAMILQPLRCVSATDEEAIKSTRIMATITWDISSKIWITGMTLHYSFPECGNKFSTETMVAVNADQVKRTAEQLQYEHWRISFVVAPIMTIRDEREEGEIRTSNLRNAEVVIMK
ncbi:hypothetical protein F4779DRAFT_618620 [Xylariaceae sp. FL0662B]|nr:hypothetical protein F4779DRAFT_618620 [Xylariaceae sp. FL0662B]